MAVALSTAALTRADFDNATEFAQGCLWAATELVRIAKSLPDSKGKLAAHRESMLAGSLIDLGVRLDKCPAEFSAVLDFTRRVNAERGYASAHDAAFEIAKEVWTVAAFADGTSENWDGRPGHYGLNRAAVAGSLDAIRSVLAARNDAGDAELKHVIKSESSKAWAVFIADGTVTGKATDDVTTWAEMSPAEWAELFGLKSSALKNAIDNGEIRVTVMSARRWRVHPDDALRGLRSKALRDKL